MDTKQALATGLIAAALSPCAALAQAENFDTTTIGQLPAGWLSGVTGRGTPRWEVVADPTAPSARNVLQQSGSGTFPWAVKRDVALADGWVETRFKAIAGREDQAGGVLWRWKDGDNYYVARANAGENNVSLYRTTGGSRRTIRYVDAPVPRDTWHTLRVEFAARHIRVIYNGRVVIEADDDHIAGAGAIGVWTKADSVTRFDDVRWGR